MSYYPSIPTNIGYVLPLSASRSGSSLRKQIEPEEKHKTIVINDQDFSARDIQTILMDVKDTRLNRFLVGAIDYMEEHAPNELVQQALPYIYALNEKTIAYDILDFPPLSVSLPANEELLVEWNFEHFKIGMSFETDSDESGWYIVHDSTVNKMTAWGYLNSQTVVELVDTILSQAVENVP